MKIFFTVILALASPTLPAMTPERFSENAGPLCREHPNQAICKKWRARQTANTESRASQPKSPEARASQPESSAGDKVTLSNDKWRWLEVPGSAMDSVHKPEIDEQWDYRGGAANSWRMIQAAWSGAAVVGNRMYVTGGGHADGAHNGVLAVDIGGNWERITEPSPIWTEDTCPSRLCSTVHGECKLGTCTTGPDGAPVAVHSYNGLAIDGDYLYRSGGSIWRHGNAGVGPRNFRLNLNSGHWSTFPESGWESTMSNLVHVDGKLYLMTRKGIGVFDIASNKWRRSGRVETVSAKARMLYDEQSDRIYVFGGGWASWVKRERFGSEWHKIKNPPDLLNTKHIGVAKQGDLFLFWVSGPDLVTYDPVTEEWGEISPAGTPGEGIPAGPHGRFDTLDGRLVLVNGTSRNMYWLLAPGEVYTPPTSDQNPPSNPEPDKTSDVSVVTSRSGTGSLPQIELLSSPYYEQPQADILERTCGPLSDWEVRDLKTDTQVEQQGGFSSGDRVIFNIHWKTQIYPTLRLKGLSCALVRGIRGPSGQLPKIRSVNMTRSPKRGLIQGGLQIEDLYISMYEATERFGDIKSGDCIGIPNSSQFAIFRNIEVVGCQHHSFITSQAYSLYLEIANSKFKYAKSHLAYIDSVAMAYIHDSTFESPGWGHALRCIAGKCLIENVKVSNIDIDGKISAPRGKEIVGMHPLEVYNCGGPHLVKNVEINFYRSREILAGSHASHFRTRDAKWGCDLAFHDGKQWHRFDYGSAEWLANNNWPERKLKYQDVTVNCLTDKIETNSIGCYGIDTWGSHPVGNNNYRSGLQQWLRKNQFESWESMISALPGAPLPYPHDWYLWTASRLLPEQRKAWLKGQFLNKWPVEPHPSAPANLAVLELENVSINNGIGPFIAPRAQSRRYCWGSVKANGACSDMGMPEARISSGE